jgi:hypothetical protein
MHREIETVDRGDVRREPLGESFGDNDVVGHRDAP